MRRRAFVAAIATALLCAGCAHERTKELARIPEGSFARGAGGLSSVPPRERAAYERTARADGWDALPVSAATDAVPAAAPAEVVMTTASASPEVKTSAAPRAHAKWAPGVTAAQVAREEFLNAVTTIDAEKATVYVPAEYAGEASLSGASVLDDGPGRRTASGSGELTLRHLTVRARRLTVVVRSEAGSDFQVSARGSVSLRSDQPASLVEELGVRTLLLKNDGYVPLR